MTIDELEREIRDMSSEDCLRLFERLGLGEAAKMLHATVWIYDLNKSDRDKPRAVIEYKDGFKETIDIIESVRNNAASIGHPVILLAIHRWEQIVRYHRSFRGKKEYLDLFRREPLRLKADDTLFKIAQDHLESIGEALLKGAKKRALTKEAIFVMAVGGLGYDVEYSYLRLATELLTTEEIKKIRNIKRKLNVIREKLERLGSERFLLRCEEDFNISDEEFRELRDKFLITPIIDFLKSENGGRFLHQEINLTSKSYFTKLVRPEAPSKFQLPEKDNKWREIVNEFDAWRFDMSAERVKIYRSRAGKQAKNQSSSINYTFEDWEILAGEFGDSSTAKGNLSEADFLSDDGYIEEAAVYPDFGPKQPFNEILDTSILVPNDPESFLCINISYDLAVPYPMSQHYTYLQKINSWFQSLRTWFVLPLKLIKNK